MQKYLLKISRSGWILLAIIVVGFFFRDFRHYDFLRFNPDQARDAALVRDVIAGKAPIPLLGPQAGGTDFKLGGAFYQIEIVSAKIFGESPDRLAYPDLFFSILSIVLLYFFMREFFGDKISLWLCAVFAVSFYTVKYARFAWNPNSTPFYVLLFLYSILQLVKNDQKRKWLWAVAIGLAAGIGIQLHSLLLFSFPIVLILYFAYLFWKKNPAWKFAPLIILTTLIFNAPQIANELQTGGKNIGAFFDGLENKSSREGSLAYKLTLSAVCHVQANSFMLLPLGSDSSCDFIDAQKNISENKLLPFHIVLATVFSLGGYFLLFRSWRREEDERKRNFLGLIIFYAGTLFVILIPLAAEISFRFFLVLEFMPFLLLGFWLKYLQEKFSPKSIIIVIVAVIVIINCYVLVRNFTYLAGQTKEGSNGFEEITLGEVEYMANFIETHSVGAKNVYLEGKASELFKITKPIQYFTDTLGLEVNNLKKNQAIDSSEKIFSIDVVKDSAGENSAPDGVVAEGSFNRIRIYEIEK